jgi:hypothetical protein
MEFMIHDIFKQLLSHESQCTHSNIESNLTSPARRSVCKTGPMISPLQMRICFKACRLKKHRTDERTREQLAKNLPTWTRASTKASFCLRWLTYFWTRAVLSLICSDEKLIHTLTDGQPTMLKNVQSSCMQPLSKCILFYRIKCKKNSLLAFSAMLFNHSCICVGEGRTPEYKEKDLKENIYYYTLSVAQSKRRICWSGSISHWDIFIVADIQSIWLYTGDKKRCTIKLNRHKDAWCS